MRTFEVTARIQAKPEHIWMVLTDAPSYARWNTTVDRVDGRIALGETATFRPKLQPGRGFPVRVTEFTAPNRLVLEGGMPLGLFKGVRTFLLTPQPDGSTEFSMREVFSGLLAGLIEKKIPDMNPTFQEFAACLKRCVET